MREACNQEGHIAFLDTLEVLREEVERDFRIVLAANFLSIKITLRKRSKGECQLKVRVTENFVGKVKDRSSHFIVIQMGEKLVGPKFGLVAASLAIQTLVVVKLNKRDEGCTYQIYAGSDRSPLLTLIELFRLLFQKLAVLKLAQFVYRENVKSGNPFVTLNVLHDANMPLIRKVLTDTTRSISNEAVGIAQSGERGWWFCQIRRLRFHYDVE